MRVVRLRIWSWKTKKVIMFLKILIGCCCVLNVSVGITADIQVVKDTDFEPTLNVNLNNNAGAVHILDSPLYAETRAVAEDVENTTIVYNGMYFDLSIGGGSLEDAVASNETWTRSDDGFEATTECVGLAEFCNLTREEYVTMLNEYIFPQNFEWVLIASHALVFTVGLVGNALVCVAVYRNHSMRTVTNYFIVNLAVADFLVILVCLPPTVLWDVTETWFFGSAVCRIVLYFQSVSVTVSVLTLAFISVDRWYAICFPLKFKSTTTRAITAILIIWCVSLLFNIPECVVLESKRSSAVRFDLDYLTQCAPTWSTESDLNWHITQAIVLYIIPLILMTIAYCQIVRVLWRSDNIPGHCESQKYIPTVSGRCNRLAPNRRSTPFIHANITTEGQLRSRRKAAKMLVAVVIMFAVCYFPVHLISVLRYAFKVRQTDVMSFLALLSHWLCYANSAVNPLIYNFMSGKFRREFRRSILRSPCGGTSADSAENFASTNTAAATHARTATRRHDSCGSYLVAQFSHSNHNLRELDHSRSFAVENNNRKGSIMMRNLSISESATTRITLSSEFETRH